MNLGHVILLILQHDNLVVATSVYHPQHHNHHEHHHSAPNIHENFNSIPTPQPPQPTHDPPNLPVMPKCPRHGLSEKGSVSTNNHNPTSISLSNKNGSKPKVKDTKEIMKKRRERAICVVSISPFSILRSLFIFTTI